MQILKILKCFFFFFLPASFYFSLYGLRYVMMTICQFYYCCRFHLYLWYCPKRTTTIHIAINMFAYLHSFIENPSTNLTSNNYFSSFDHFGMQNSWANAYAQLHTYNRSIYRESSHWSCWNSFALPTGLLCRFVSCIHKGLVFIYLLVFLLQRFTALCLSKRLN